MRRSKPYEGKAKGLVYLVSTPIGNLQDITYRAVDILSECDIIACEDTRNTALLLKRYDIHPKKLVSLYSQIEDKEGERLVREVKEKGLVLAFCSDAGMPGISDPGGILVHKCHELDVPVTILPGPNAALSALVLSGLDSADFSFFGFLPPKKAAMTSFLKAIQDRKETLIFYESPKRIADTLKTMASVLGDRKASVLRELTKIHEEILQGTLAELAAIEEFKGECVIVVSGAKEKHVDEKELKREILSLLKEGMAVKEVSRILSERHSLKKGDVYSLALKLRPKTKDNA